MALPLQNSAEGGSNGTGVTTGNSGGGSGNAFDAVGLDSGGGTLTFDNTHPAHGSLGYKNVEAAVPVDTVYLEWNTSLGTITEMYGRVYLYRTANPNTVHEIVQIRNAASNARNGYVQISSGGLVRVGDHLGNESDTLTAISLNQQIRIEFHYLASATVGIIEAKLFNTADSSTADDMSTRANVDTGTDVGACRFGQGRVSDAGGTYWMDDLYLTGAGYPGPAAPPVQPNLIRFSSGQVW